MTTEQPAHRNHPLNTLRPIEIECGFLKKHPGSVLYSSGDTRVLCTAVLEDEVPRFLDPEKSGWATAEYNMMPSATSPRFKRERSKISGRTQEIQRLIGRALRAVIDFSAFPGKTLKLDCDVIEADGGTRTASISGVFIASALAIDDAIKNGRLEKSPLIGYVSAVSVGVLKEDLVLDLNYEEDSAADVDMNVAMMGEGKFIEVQGTAEGDAFSREQLNQLLDLATEGNLEIQKRQRETLAACGVKL